MNPKREISRRQFVVAGSISLFAATLLGPRVFFRGGAGAEEAGAQPLARNPFPIGYWIGSDAWSLSEGMDPMSASAEIQAVPAAVRDGSPASSVQAEVVPAERLATGDATLLGTGAWLTIHGLVEADQRRSGSVLEEWSVFVEYDVSVRGESKTVSSLAWRYQRSPVTNLSAPVRLLVPLDASGNLRLSLVRRETEAGLAGRLYEALLSGTRAAGAPVRKEERVCLTAGSDAGKPKLRRGLYVIASVDSRRREGPVWQRLPRQSIGAAEARRFVQTGLRGAPRVDFDYLVVSIEPAQREPLTVSRA